MRYPFLPSSGGKELLKDDVSPEALARCSTGPARALLAYELACSHGVLPLAILELRGESFLTLACARLIEEGESAFRFLTGHRCRFLLFPEPIVRGAISLAYHGGAHRLESAIQRVADRPASILPEQKDLSFSSTQIENVPEIELLKVLLEYAISQGASDLHMIPRRNRCTVRMRLKSGELTDERELCAATVHQRIIRRLKLMARLDITQTEIAHDGQIEISMNGGLVRARLSIIPTIFGEKSVLRFIANQKIPDFFSLGYSRKVEEIFSRVAREGRGLTLVCGATGSGKTTSLYSILEREAEKGKNIISVEDPAECAAEWMTQTEIGREGKLSYPGVLKSFLRQDPDIIFVGEMRDRETVQIAVQAALTGHTIFSSFHAGSVSDAIARLQSYIDQPDLIFQASSLIIAQRLVPKLCPECRQIDPLASDQIGFSVYRATGCDACLNSGFKGKTVVAEALQVTQKIKDRIADRTLLRKILEEHRGEYYLSFKDSFEDLLRRGEIGMNTATP